MKMLLMSALMWGLGIQAASAAKSPLTPEEFTEAQKKRAEAKGVPFDLDHVEFLFNAMDRDSDGLVTAEEKEAYWVRRESQRKKKTGPVKPVVTATAKPKRPNVTETLDEYMERQKARQTQRGARFNEEKFLKVFREMDADADGSVTPEESKVYWKAKNR